MNIKKELAIFFGIFLFLALAMHHKEWLSHPINHLMALPKAGAFGLGPLHPLIFTLMIYLPLALIRWIVHLFEKKK